jgi:hypothetical protein
MEHLEGELGLVAVRDLVNNGHPADAENLIHAVLPAKRRAKVARIHGPV